MNKILLENIDKPDQKRLAGYRERGGYKALEKALGMEPAAIIEEVKTSGLRGRGGAGFPTGMKWGFVPRNTGKPTYLLCNADESEPGTFKDRILLEYDPHLIIEGMAIACVALGCHLSYIYMRGEFEFLVPTVQGALDEAYEAGILGPSVLGKDFALDLFLHLGQGAYICGEETSLIESLEGYRGYPRIKPPFPAVQGFLASPTVVNNVETLCALPWIINNGGQAYAAIGTERARARSSSPYRVTSTSRAFTRLISAIRFWISSTTNAVACAAEISRRSYRAGLRCRCLRPPSATACCSITNRSRKRGRC
jgi:NADH-quinone oxidoreductase subunit F